MFDVPDLPLPEFDALAWQIESRTHGDGFEGDELAQHHTPAPRRRNAQARQRLPKRKAAQIDSLQDLQIPIQVGSSMIEGYPS